VIPGILLYMMLAAPPVAAWLEGSMVGQMLVQIPLLALAGDPVARSFSSGRGSVLAVLTQAVSPASLLRRLLLSLGCCRGCSMPPCAARWWRGEIYHRPAPGRSAVGAELAAAASSRPRLRVGEPDLPCRRPGLALLRCAEPAVHALSLRSAGGPRDGVVSRGDGVAARVGRGCDRWCIAGPTIDPNLIQVKALRRSSPILLWICIGMPACAPWML